MTAVPITPMCNKIDGTVLAIENRRFPQKDRLVKDFSADLLHSDVDSLLLHTVVSITLHCILSYRRATANRNITHATVNFVRTFQSLLVLCK